MSALTWALWIVAALESINALLVINQTGKPRSYSPAVVAVTTALNAAVIVIVVLAALKLGAS